MVVLQPGLRQVVCPVFPVTDGQTLLPHYSRLASLLPRAVLSDGRCAPQLQLCSFSSSQVCPH